ncbi:phage minor head protein [Pantoea sp. BAV 3049]|uniref:phage head morphogenesis protein n=1 Tax=Pantoea sp. BAV 3049 TaxID=2654188 RepID=UPI00131D4CE4|nr:phage minor head protein [Pantoea sp. BAV 3049]
MKRKLIWLHPVSVEITYRAALLKATRQFNRNITDYYGDIRFDAWDDDMSSVLAALRNLSNRIFSPVIERLPNLFSLTSQINDRQWRLVVKGGTGFELPPSQAVIAGQTIVPTSSGVLGVDSYRAEPWLADMQKVWVSENTRLIKSIPTGQLDDMQGIIQRGVMNGTSAGTIKDQIVERYGISENRAKLIAVDQIGKANSALTQQRQKDAGIDGYIWRGVLDNRERQVHIDREGKSFKWSSPPSDGHPGQPVRCRCYAEPDWTGSVFDIN